MQVIPQDPGYATLTAALIKLSDSEQRAALINKQMRLDQLNKMIELRRQLGDKPGLEDLTGREQLIQNQLAEAAPATALDALLKQSVPSQLPKTIEDLKAMQAKGQGNILQNLSQLANSPGAIGAEQNFEQWEETPYRSKKFLDYQTAGDAMRQTIDNFYKSIKGKSPLEIAENYNKTAAQLTDIGETYRRPLTETELRRLLSGVGGGAGKPIHYKAYTNKADAGKSYGFMSSSPPGSERYLNDMLAAGRRAIRPGLTLYDLTDESHMGTGQARTFSTKELEEYRTDQELQAQNAFKNIFQMDIPEEQRLSLYEQAAQRFHVAIKVKEGFGGKYEVDDQKFDTRNAGILSAGTTTARDVQNFFLRSVDRNQRNMDAAEERLRRKMRMNR